MMLYWMNDDTGKVIAREEGDHPGEKWFEISPDDYKANLHPLSRPTQRTADFAVCTCPLFFDSGKTEPPTCEFCGLPQSR